ncbi:SDR family NAD(P)-dependent oxidoreductase [Brucella gallinifaecis]|uniref:SDR family oxidoreductase n=1 Tax=Brucella gallinifaecis TaxID=215590 RepID=A0A502BMP8_9HYPH|nr:SDR family oxidoreductase [Brucella gallinifaecis]TPF74343.1 SDR family oxidoreductase [Brucella gallinifaecis]
MNEIEKTFGLHGKKALITGGGSGIGFAIAQAMAQAGAEVVVVGRRQNVLDSAVLSIPGSSAEVVDLADIKSLSEAARTIDARYNGIDILVNNAGNTIRKPFSETTCEDIDSILDVHLRGALEFTRPIITAQAGRGHGSVLFTASMASYMGLPYVIGYSAAKSALLGVVRGLSAEFAPQGVRVNAIAPGWIDTPLYRGATGADEARKAKALSRIQMGTIGTAEDIGWASVYLSSPAASYITGQTLAVDGGALAGF